MTQLSKGAAVISWLLQFVVAGILLQTLFFKFTGAEESIYIFSTVGQFVHLPAFEPWGRLGTGVVELAASLMLLFPATASIGALLTIAVMVGAIASHAFVLGIRVNSDGGLLFGLAVTALAGSLAILILRRSQIAMVSRYFQFA